MFYTKVNQAARKTLNPVHVGVSTRAVSGIPDIFRAANSGMTDGLTVTFPY
jgi:hypothetical protein